MAQFQLKPKVITGKNIDGSAVTLTASHPQQLCLFQSFSDNIRTYSNTVALYDALPIYFSSTSQLDELRTSGGYLPTETRYFEYKEPSTEDTVKHELRMTPARIQDKDGKDREYYPTMAEKYPVDALRRLATQPEHGCYLDNIAGVMFTRNQLHRELAEHGHSRNSLDLLHQLEVSSGTRLEVMIDGAKSSIVKATILPVLVLPTREEWEANPDIKCYAQFNPLVTSSINDFTFRQFDYGTYMGLKRQLSQWLFIRLSHHFIYAHVDKPYQISAKRMLNDSYLSNYSKFTDNINKGIRKTLEELQDNKIIAKVNIKPEKKGTKIIDVKYELFPTENFSDCMRGANYRLRAIKTQAEQWGGLPQI